MAKTSTTTPCPVTGNALEREFKPNTFLLITTLWTYNYICLCAHVFLLYDKINQIESAECVPYLFQWNRKKLNTHSRTVRTGFGRNGQTILITTGIKVHATGSQYRVSIIVQSIDRCSENCCKKQKHKNK